MSNQKLESHVVNLEIAKQMKEAGWEKETEFWWFPDCNKVYQGFEKEKPKIKWLLQPYFKGMNIEYSYPAPLATEILEELPEVYFHKTGESIYISGYGVSNTTKDNLLNALAKFWLYLKKENLL